MMSDRGQVGCCLKEQGWYTLNLVNVKGVGRPGEGEGAASPYGTCVDQYLLRRKVRGV